MTRSCERSKPPPKCSPKWRSTRRNFMSRFFGSIRQNGYVVRDIEAALKHWTTVLGVGPFFYFERVQIDDFRYRGQPSNAEFSIALANSGALQIELIQQRNNAPSM